MDDVPVDGGKQYIILGLDPHSEPSGDQIKKARDKKIRKSMREGVEVSEDIIKAYNVLSDPDKRLSYDLYNGMSRDAADRMKAEGWSQIPVTLEPADAFVKTWERLRDEVEASEAARLEEERLRAREWEDRKERKEQWKKRGWKQWV